MAGAVGVARAVGVRSLLLELVISYFFEGIFGSAYVGISPISFGIIYEAGPGLSFTKSLSLPIKYSIPLR